MNTKVTKEGGRLEGILAGSEFNWTKSLISVVSSSVTFVSFVFKDF